ncbi:MAG: inositol monophosphatase family protein, partial [Halobacteria archaeon]|nr:inositol monophosphatase family protein [Halobacteria archaeon]
GVVYHTPMDDMYTVVRGEGAYRNGDSITVSSAKYDESLLVTGFTGESSDEDDFFGLLRRVVEETHGVRRFGSAAYDLVTVAEGSTDGFFERHLNPWDIAAGVLILQEAGGKVTDFDGNEGWEKVREGNVMATNGEAHQGLLDTYASL